MTEFNSSGVHLLAISISFTFLTQWINSIIARKRREQVRKKYPANYVSNQSVCVSAPGKILLTGGYLILEKVNKGIVVATTARFYSSVQVVSINEANRLHPNLVFREDEVTILVNSPQLGCNYIYLFAPESGTINNASGSKNPFVEKSLLVVLLFIKIYIGSNIFVQLLNEIRDQRSFFFIKLQADNDFYSQISELKTRNLPLLSESLSQLPKFLPCNQGESISKTGLGSSATLTTSLVSSLLQWFSVVRLGTRIGSEDRRIVHNLSQVVHSIAQGKIGSGFDISAAVYGSQVYKRYKPELIAPFLEELINPQALFELVVSNTTSNGWDQSISEFHLPPGFGVILGDVCGGSSSPLMAKKVLAWRQSSQDTSMWNELSVVNNQIEESFADLNKLAKDDPTTYWWGISTASTIPATEWTDRVQTSEWMNNECVRLLFQLRNRFKAARSLLKRMGELSGVQIEPNDQSQLADATEGNRGVLVCGVPGAGGEDALFAIVFATEQEMVGTRLSVELYWSQWNASSTTSRTVCPLMLQAEQSDEVKQGLKVHYNSELFHY